MLFWLSANFAEAQTIPNHPKPTFGRASNCKHQTHNLDGYRHTEVGVAHSESPQGYLIERHNAWPRPAWQCSVLGLMRQLADNGMTVVVTGAARPRRTSVPRAASDLMPRPAPRFI